VLIPRNRMSAALRAVFDAAEARAVTVVQPYNLVQYLQLIPQFSILVRAVVAGGLAGALSGKGPFTLFAPNDYAFSRLPPGAIEKLLKNVTELDAILTYHVANGNVSSSQLTNGEKVPTLNGKDVNVEIFTHNGITDVVLNRNARVLNANNYATNGVFHEIDNVLIPQ
jgi:uncharacterized surface protein with fasciclin (FAS1) repeats